MHVPTDEMFCGGSGGGGGGAYCQLSAILTRVGSVSVSNGLSKLASGIPVNHCDRNQNAPAFAKPARSNAPNVLETYGLQNAMTSSEERTSAEADGYRIERALKDCVAPPSKGGGVIH